MIKRKANDCHGINAAPTQVAIKARAGLSVVLVEGRVAVELRTDPFAQDQIGQVLASWGWNAAPWLPCTQCTGQSVWMIPPTAPWSNGAVPGWLAAKEA